MTRFPGRSLCAFLIFTLISPLSHAQDRFFPSVDTFALNFAEPYDDVSSLARQLTGRFDTELEKSRALFMWIAANVRYDCKKYHKPPQNRITAASEAELIRKMAAYRREQAERTAKFKRGICEDYSQLFKALCDEAGLEAVVIVGNGRDFHKPYRNNHNNPHAWNAVRIEGQWYLLDATWGAGHVNSEVTKFTRKVGSGYFMTPPSSFGLNHFPDDPQWQLLEKPVDKKAFSAQPLINYGEDKYPILDFFTGATSIQQGDYDREIRIRFAVSPKFFLLTRQNGKPLDFQHDQENGYEVFRFSSRGVGSLSIYGGDSRRSRMGWLGRYDL